MSHSGEVIVSVGLIALLDDVAAIAKVAAASVDDVAAQAMKAGAKAAGVVIDDTAVTPSYVVGFSAKRELPIIGKITLGSLKNKLLILLPAALFLSAYAPWAISPLLTLGGAYLCYEGAEKVFEAVAPHEAHEHEEAVEPVAMDAKTLEDQKVAGAIKTDFILSAEIMTIALSAVDSPSLITRASVLAAVAVMITLGVYGAVALLVKLDDLGMALARRGKPGSLRRALGLALVNAMPYVLQTLSVLGTAAMLWVGGQIVLHGLETFGVAAPAHFVHEWAQAAAHAAPAWAQTATEWGVSAALSGLFGLALGLALIPAASYVVSPILKGFKSLVRRAFNRTDGAPAA
jgi:hypothetical protein